MPPDLMWRAMRQKSYVRIGIVAFLLGGMYRLSSVADYLRRTHKSRNIQLPGKKWICLFFNGTTEHTLYNSCANHFAVIVSSLHITHNSSNFSTKYNGYAIYIYFTNRSTLFDVHQVSAIINFECIPLSMNSIMIIQISKFYVVYKR